MLEVDREHERLAERGARSSRTSRLLLVARRALSDSSRSDEGLTTSPRARPMFAVADSTPVVRGRMNDGAPRNSRSTRYRKPKLATRVNSLQARGVPDSRRSMPSLLIALEDGVAHECLLAASETRRL